MIQWLKKNVAGILCTVLALGAGGVLGYLLAGSTQRQTPIPQSLQEQLQPSVQQENSVEADTDVCWTYVFSECGHTLQMREKDGPLTGYSRTDIEAEYPNITIQTINEQRTELLYEVDAHCPEHYVLILTTEGVLQVRRTNVDTLAVETVMTLSFDVSGLSRQVQDALLEGMTFDTLEEINRYLEDAES